MLPGSSFRIRALASRKKGRKEKHSAASENISQRFSRTLSNGCLSSERTLMGLLTQSESKGDSSTLQLLLSLETRKDVPRRTCELSYQVDRFRTTLLTNRTVFCQCIATHLLPVMPS